MSADPTELWQPEANRALQEWRNLYDAKKNELIRAAPGNIHDPNTAIAIGAEAKHLFDVVGEQILQEVRRLLTGSNTLDEIGTPEQATQILIDPLEHKAREAIANLRHQIKRQNLVSTGLPDAHLAHTQQELQNAATTLRPRLQTEIRLRRKQIEQATKLAAEQSNNNWWQRFSNKTSVAQFFLPIIIFVFGYLVGTFSLFSRLLRLFGLSGDSPTSSY